MGTTLQPGMKVSYRPQPGWGIGHLLSLEDEGTKAWVAFPLEERRNAILVSTRGDALVHAELEPGTQVATKDYGLGSIRGLQGSRQSLRTYLVLLEGGQEAEIPEGQLRALPPRADFASALADFDFGDARNFDLRARVLQLDDERRSDALGALLASRVMVKAHQVGVVQRVLSSPRPRFILADEVGLGKTIEAGMVFTALRLTGLAQRVLVIVPAHLAIQWLVEMSNKFNKLFIFMDAERFRAARQANPEVSPWTQFDLVIASLEFVQGGHGEEAAAAGWDLVVVDEAHHLKSPDRLRAMRKVAETTFGLLLLTATPMQLDPQEYCALLALVDPETAPTVPLFEERLRRQAALAASVRALLSAEASAADLVAVRSRFPKDGELASLSNPAAILSHLAETYSLSSQLIRNRRALIGGFTQRYLHVHPVTLSSEALAVRALALDRVRSLPGLSGAALTRLVQRMESSHAAFVAAIQGRAECEGVPVEALRSDPKEEALVALLQRQRANERGAKFLVFAESRDTLNAVLRALGDARIEALAYHGDLAFIERDRHVARFRDPEGPAVLVCTEVGGEGRNFQFAHHLVSFDLPWSPAVMEQRIGRLDRLGQLHPVHIHVFDVAGTFSAFVLALLRDAVGVFTETVGGLDAVLESVEGDLTRLLAAPVAERRAFSVALTKKVRRARSESKNAYDPLLDLRSFDRDAVRDLITRAQARAGISSNAADTIDDALWGLARDLDERLEDVVCEVARRIGIRVDTDEDVDAFQTAFHLGHALAIDALPGFDISKERTLLGTFWRDTAVEIEEIDFFGTGHPLVEALFALVRDGPFGRNGVRRIQGSEELRGMEFLFVVQAPEPSDTHPGAKVPSRHVERYLGNHFLRIAVVRNAFKWVAASEVVKRELRASPGDPINAERARRELSDLLGEVEEARTAARSAASAEFEQARSRARDAIASEGEAECRRIARSLSHQGVEASAIAQATERQRTYAREVADALDACRLVLDAACAFVMSRRF